MPRGAVQGADASDLAPLPIEEANGLLPARDAFLLTLAVPERYGLVVDRHRLNGLALGWPPRDVESTRVGAEDEHAPLT
jgi:hypothetical protein